jgi:hypothetical protein
MRAADERSAPVQSDLEPVCGEQLVHGCDERLRLGDAAVVLARINDPTQ